MVDLTYNALINTLEVRNNIIRFDYLTKNYNINIGDRIHFDGDILEVLEHTIIDSEYGTLICKIFLNKGLYDMKEGLKPKCKEMSIEEIDKWIIIYEKCISEPVLSEDLMESIAIRLRDLKFERIFRKEEK